MAAIYKQDAKGFQPYVADGIIGFAYPVESSTGGVTPWDAVVGEGKGSIRDGE